MRRAALTTAGRLRSPRLWSAVIGNLDQVSYHASAGQALVEAGAEAIPYLARALGDPQASIVLRVRVATISGRIGGAEAIAMLRGRMDADDRHLRTAILDALARAGYRAASGTAATSTTSSGWSCATRPGCGRRASTWAPAPRSSPCSGPSTDAWRRSASAVCAC